MHTFGISKQQNNRLKTEQRGILTKHLLCEVKLLNCITWQAGTSLVFLDLNGCFKCIQFLWTERNYTKQLLEAVLI